MDEAQLDTRQTAAAADRQTTASCDVRDIAASQADTRQPSLRIPTSFHDALRFVLLLPVLLVVGVAGVVATSAALIWHGLFGGRRKGPLP